MRRLTTTCSTLFPVFLVYGGLSGLLLTSVMAQGGDQPQTQSVKVGVTHVVAVNGSDDGPGTAERPWATINHAAKLAQAGDTVVVRGGTYSSPPEVRPLHSGRADA